jgi:uncharacterized protein YndB with AHSA1/START domain
MELRPLARRGNELSSAEVTRPSAREVFFTRLIDAPVDLVWEAWSELRHLHEWYGPAGFTATTEEFAFASGGVWRLTMHGPDGTDYPTLIKFRTIEPKKRIVYLNRWDLPGAPIEFTIDVTFAAEGGGTRLTLLMTFANDADVQTAVEIYGVLSGGVETFERIAEYVTRRRDELQMS